MKGIASSLVLAFLLSGCTMMGSKQFQRQQEFWQSAGRMAGFLECQEQMLSIQWSQLNKNNNAAVQQQKETENGGSN